MASASRLIERVNALEASVNQPMFAIKGTDRTGVEPHADTGSLHSDADGAAGVIFLVEDNGAIDRLIQSIEELERLFEQARADPISPKRREMQLRLADVQEEIERLKPPH